MKSGKPIFIVDDNELDRELLEYAVRRAGAVGEVVQFSGGQALMDHLNDLASDPQKAATSLPNLIFLDHSMPLMDAPEVLDALQSDPVFREIPVILLTGSLRDEGAVAGSLEGIRAVYRKPVLFEELVEIMNEIAGLS